MARRRKSLVEAETVSEGARLKAFDLLLFALKALLTINGGAAIALVALLSSIARDQPLPLNIAVPALWALFSFAVGVVAAVWAGLFAYVGLRGWKPFEHLSLGLLLVSIATFNIGIIKTSGALLELMGPS